METLVVTAPVLPGQVPCWYSGPSKSTSVNRHPVNDAATVVPAGLTIGAGKQERSSKSGLDPLPSEFPFVQRKLELAWLQYSKWPISSEKATLYECAAHSTRVLGVDVLYIGW